MKKSSSASSMHVHRKEVNDQSFRRTIKTSIGSCHLFGQFVIDAKERFDFNLVVEIWALPHEFIKPDYLLGKVCRTQVTRETLIGAANRYVVTLALS